MGSESKRITILDAAEKRFAHFGLNKTTMNDIASDLAMSKASLYYYFPDKSSLYTAVFEREVERSYKKVLAHLNTLEDIDELFSLALHSRMEFIQRNYNMLNFSMNSLQSQDMNKLSKLGKDYQIKILTFILEKCFRNDQIQDLDIEYVSRLIYFAMEGMRLSKMNNLESRQFPSQDDFNSILKMQEDFLMIVINGIRKENTSLQISRS